MANSKYDEEHIKHLLKNMPEIEDEKTSEEHFRAVTEKVNRSGRKSNWTSRYLPLAATAAIFLLAGLLILPALFERNSENIASENARDESVNMETGENPATESGPADEENGPSKNTALSDFQSRLVSAKKKDGYATVAYPGPGGNFIVPVSIPLSSGTTPIEVFNSPESFWDPASAGLDPFLLAGSSFTENQDGSSLEIHVPADHQFAFGSATETAFTETAAYMAALGDYENADLFTGESPGIMLGNFGEIETISEKDVPPSGYFKYEAGGSIFLVPYPHPGPGGAIGDILTFMKDGIASDNAKVLRPLIPDKIDISAAGTEDGGLLEVSLSIAGEAPDSDEISLMQEGILMAARHARYDMVLFNLTGGQFPQAQYPFGEKIPVPAAPNPVRLQ